MKVHDVRASFKRRFIKFKLLLFIYTCLSLLTNKVMSQIDSIRHQPDIPAKFAGCGSNDAVISEANQQYYNYINNLSATVQAAASTVGFIPQGGFPSNLIVQCGHFNIYYEDDVVALNDGFADLSLGTARKNTLCAVLTYIENTLNISTTIDLFVDRSLTPVNNPAPLGTGWLANANAYQNANFNGNISGIYAGNMLEHITSGVDPDPNNYDGRIQVNFDNVNGQSILYWDDFNNTSADCAYDLYTVLLHEVTHTLGIFSLIREDGTANNLAINFVGGNRFSLYDWLFLFKGDVNNTVTFQKLLVGSLTAPVINAAINVAPNPLRSNDIWINNNGIPLNHPVYCGNLDPFYGIQSGSLLSHLNDQILSFNSMTQFSPGFQPPYVMAPSITEELQKRTWSLAELRMLLLMTYTLNPSFSTAITINGTDQNGWLLNNNSPAYSDLVTTQPVTTYLGSNLFPETSPVDFSLTNNNTLLSPNTSQLIISLPTDAHLLDLNSDPISIMPNTLFGIRGVSTNANNHGRLSIVGNNQITYTPEIGYHGRTQFGFYLWDGHEKGALKIYTTDVVRGASYIVAFGNNYVINGGYEDGSEIYQRGIIQTNPYSSSYNLLNEGEYFHGHHFSGGHPHTWTSNAWNLGGGDIIREGWQPCFMNGNPVLLGWRGYATNIWNTSFAGSFNYPVPTGGPPNERYHIQQYGLNFSTLSNSLTQNWNYSFSGDLNFEKTTLTLGQTYNFTLEFITDPSPDFTAYSTILSIPCSMVVSTIAPDTWQHFDIPIQYCAATSSYFINIVGTTQPVFIDNISIIDIIPHFVTINAGLDQTIQPGCNSSGCVILNSFPSDQRCGLIYSWTPISGLSDPTIQNPTACPTSTTTYTVTVTDPATGQTASDQVVVTVLPPVNCFSINKTASITNTYAGHPLKFYIEICNNTSIPQNIAVDDYLPINFSVVGPNPFSSHPTILNNFPVGCTTYTITGEYNQYGDCPDPNLTNTAVLHALGTDYTSSACVSVMRGCPLIMFGNSDCQVGSTVPMRLECHTIMQNVNRIRVGFVHPNFIDAPGPGNIMANIWSPFPLISATNLGTTFNYYFDVGTGVIPLPIIY